MEYAITFLFLAYGVFYKWFFGLLIDFQVIGQLYEAGFGLFTRFSAYRTAL